MDKELIVIRPVDQNDPESARFQVLMEQVLTGKTYKSFSAANQLVGWISAREKREKKGEYILLFAVFIGHSGMCIQVYQMLQVLREFGEHCLDGCTGGIIIDGDTDLYTRSVGREILLTASMRGCIFPGKPLVEGTKNLLNFEVIAGNMGLDREAAYFVTAKELLDRICGFKPPRWEKPLILVLHASNRETSNTLAYWGLARERLTGCQIQEIHIENGTVVDCIGCPYTMCLHYGKKDACFYGGIMIEEIYPAISACNVLVLLCPNYNDALSANLSAFINRLTALFRKTPFYDKYIYTVVVSGYSGSDIVARQVISALNINKAFILPPRFAAMETANNPGSIFGNTGVEERAAGFAADIAAMAGYQGLT